jgi:hypothetical protein
MAKLSEKPADGTSFHNITIKCTPQQLIDLLGAPQCLCNDGSDKTNFDWTCETASGKVFTIYDWKYYRFLDLNESIRWNIGSYDSGTSIVAKDEIMGQLIKNKLQNA